VKRKLATKREKEKDGEKERETQIIRES